MGDNFLLGRKGCNLQRNLIKQSYREKQQQLVTQTTKTTTTTTSVLRYNKYIYIQARILLVVFPTEDKSKRKLLLGLIWEQVEH